VNVNLLIDAIVRQTTVLIAQLATAGGARAPLAHTANQVFLDLIRELKEQGLGNKVIADMFGLSLRTYHKKMARLSESSTDRGRSLWEALLAYVTDKGPVTRAEVLLRFQHDEDPTVRGVLKDLVASGLLFESGRGDLKVYRAATAEDTPRGTEDARARAANLAWVAVYRYGPLSAAELVEHVPLPAEMLDAILGDLTRDGRVTEDDRPGTTVFRSTACVMPPGSPAGWEAAVFDHYQAMVTAICTKLRLGRTQASAGEAVGGSTYSYDVWVGHPVREDVLGFLQETRDRAVALRKRVEEHNRQHRAPEEAIERVIAYVGQTVVSADEPADAEGTEDT
jgi:hypothetical protein